MIDFLRESDNFAGVTFSGCFNIDMSDLEILYKHYQETGENLLDAYCKIIYLLWGDYEYIDPEERRG